VSALPAKASVPRVTNAAPRARVFKLLDRALSRGAAWIVAPAGAGKTTAVSSYLGARRRHAVWYDVDAADADCANVFLYLPDALRAATRSRRSLPAYQVQHHGSLRAFAQKFFEGFFAALPAGSMLVLDNCHTVAGNDDWEQILDEAARAVPHGRGLIVISRSEPPARLARLVVNERLVLMTGEELRFTTAEATALARARLQARAPRDKRPAARRELRELCEVAGGWAAGLVLVLDHAARGEPTPELARRDERLFDYFSAEILTDLPADAQHVLQATALLPCMTDVMAAAVSGSANAGAVIADLHRRGLLVERLPTVPVSYRYHPLLRAFLLARETPSPDVLVRAAAACAEGGFLDEAVDLHSRAGALDRIAALVLGNARRLVAEGRYQTLAAWLERLGEEPIAAEPWLCFWQATANVLLDQAASQAQFEQAFEGFRQRADAAGLYLCIAGVAQVIFLEAEDFGRLDPWFRRFSELRAQGPPPPSDDVEARSLTSLLMASAYARPGHAELDAWIERALQLAPNDAGARLRLWSAVAMCHSLTGRFQAAADRQAGLGPEVGAVRDPVTRMMVNGAAINRAFVGSWRGLLEAGQRALTIARAEGLLLFEPTNLLVCAQACAFGGDDAAASDHLRQAVEAAARVPLAHLFRGGFAEYTQACVAFAARRFDEAAACLEVSLARNLRTGCRWGQILCRALRCVMLAALDRHEQAAREAASMVGDVAPIGRAAVATALVEAEALLRAGDPAGGQAAARALDQSRAHGSCTSFYLRGLPSVMAYGLRDPARAHGLRDQVVNHRMKPWPQHLDLAAWPFAVRVQTLGTFALDAAAGRRSRKVQKAPLRLLKCLVAGGGNELSVGAVCDALWGEDPPATARRRLDITLHRLRALLGEDVVQLAGGALAIDRTRCFVDAWAFASLAEQVGRTLRRDGASAPSAQALELFADAERLYRGAFLDGDDDLPQIIAYRERLRRQWTRLVLAVAVALEPHAGERAIAVYESALAVDEQAAPLWQGLMRAYLSSARPADAVTGFQRAQLALHAGDGAGLTEELRALHEEARNRMRGRPGVVAVARR
jgi:ATP/maltotriose-dependent transcriptional regulator MalT/DNA-binding SARP family transcriptional activator